MLLIGFNTTCFILYFIQGVLVYQRLYQNSRDYKKVRVRFFLPRIIESQIYKNVEIIWSRFKTFDNWNVGPEESWPPGLVHTGSTSALNPGGAWHLGTCNDLTTITYQANRRACPKTSAFFIIIRCPLFKIKRQISIPNFEEKGKQKRECSAKISRRLDNVGRAWGFRDPCLCWWKCG